MHVVLAFHFAIAPMLQIDLPRGATKPYVIVLVLVALAGFFFTYAIAGRGGKVIEFWTPVFNRKKAALAGGILLSESLILPPVIGLCVGIAKYW